MDWLIRATAYGAGESVTHFLFADSCFIVAHATLKEAKLLKDIYEGIVNLVVKLLILINLLSTLLKELIPCGYYAIKIPLCFCGGEENLVRI